MAALFVLSTSLAVAALGAMTLADESTDPGWNDCKKEKCDLRIIRHPQVRSCNTTDRHDPCRAARNAVDKPWALEYEYAVPSHEQMPTGKDWNAKDEVYYIWGDTDFDTYGIHPRAMFPMSKYIFNQIVPQLSLGSGLASSDPVTYKPKFITQKNWMIQAQYFWMHSNGTGYALCGTLINVTAGDIIETRIAFEPESGSMVASIGVKGGTTDQQSQITSPRPFPNEHPPLWKSWGDFFKAAEKLSQATEGEGVLNHADFNIETHGVPPDVLCDICPFALTKTAAPNQLGGKLEWVNWYPTRNMSDDGVPVGCARGCLPPP